MCTVLLPPGGYPIAVNKYIKYQNWVVTATKPSKSATIKFMIATPVTRLFKMTAFTTNTGFKMTGVTVQ